MNIGTRVSSIAWPTADCGCNLLGRPKPGLQPAPTSKLALFIFTVLAPTICLLPVSNIRAQPYPKISANDHAKAASDAPTQATSNKYTILSETDLSALAIKGDPEAQFLLADAKYSAKDYEEAVYWATEAGLSGHAEAQRLVALIYHVGYGVEQNDSTAARWYEKAANHGLPAAQCTIGEFYLIGRGVDVDVKRAAYWFRRASMQGDSRAQFYLGDLHFRGLGAEESETEGLAWLYVAGHERARELAAKIEPLLSPRAILVAHERSAAIRLLIAKEKVDRSETGSDKFAIESIDSGKQPIPSSSGSGTLISSDGHILTAAHVVAGAKRIQLVTSLGESEGKILVLDTANDVALIQAAGSGFHHIKIGNAARSVRLGQPVSTIGFPNVLIQGRSPKVTRGEISSINGFGDDPRMLQISVPIQPGNSGGPLLDESGSLVGIILSKLDASLTGNKIVVPQNVNYALKGSYILPLIEDHIKPTNGFWSISKGGSFEDMIARAQKAIVLILVFR